MGFRWGHKPSVHAHTKFSPPSLRPSLWGSLHNTIASVCDPRWSRAVSKRADFFLPRDHPPILGSVAANRRRLEANRLFFFEPGTPLRWGRLARPPTPALHIVSSFLLFVVLRVRTFTASHPCFQANVLLWCSASHSILLLHVPGPMLPCQLWLIAARQLARNTARVWTHTDMKIKSAEPVMNAQAENNYTHVPVTKLQSTTKRSKTLHAAKRSRCGCMFKNIMSGIQSLGSAREQSRGLRVVRWHCQPPWNVSFQAIGNALESRVTHLVLQCSEVCSRDDLPKHGHKKCPSFPCSLPGVAHPRICTAHPYLLSNP